jgi:hypothetical protein
MRHPRSVVAKYAPKSICIFKASELYDMHKETTFGFTSLLVFFDLGGRSILSASGFFGGYWQSLP